MKLTRRILVGLVIGGLLVLVIVPVVGYWWIQQEDKRQVLMLNTNPNIPDGGVAVITGFSLSGFMEYASRWPASVVVTHRGQHYLRHGSARPMWIDSNVGHHLPLDTSLPFVKKGTLIAVVYQREDGLWYFVPMTYVTDYDFRWKDPFNWGYQVVDFETLGELPVPSDFPLVRH